MALMGRECKEGLTAGMSHISTPSPNFDPDGFVRDIGLGAEYLDNLLNQVPCSEVNRVLREQLPVPHSDSDVGDSGETGAPSHPIFSDFRSAKSFEIQIIVVIVLVNRRRKY